MTLSAARDRLRTIALSVQPDVVDILTGTRTADGLGGHSDSWAVTHTTSGRLSPTGGGQSGERLSAERLRGRSAYELSLPHDTAIGASQRVRIEDRQLEIVDVLTPYSHQAEVRLLVVDASHFVEVL